MPSNANNSQKALEHPPARKFNFQFPVCPVAEQQPVSRKQNFPARDFSPFNVPSQLNL